MSTSVVVEWDGESVKRAVTSAVNSGLNQAANLVLSRAKEIVPFDEGVLSASGSVDSPRDLQARISFETPYAVVQHENLTYVHKNGRQAKYLETPVIESRRDIEAIVAREVSKTLGSGL